MVTNRQQKGLTFHSSDSDSVRISRTRPMTREIGIFLLTNEVLIIGYIDLFLIHDPFSGRERRLETYKALLEAKADGKIRDLGVSN